jgi:DNA-binding NarL/FixJ family response regulator
LAIIDYSMPHLNGLEATKRIKELRPAIRILLFTIDHSIWLAREALRAGAPTVLLKSDARKMLVAAVESSLAGKPFQGYNFSNEPDKLVNGKREINQILSSRESTVVKLVAEGYSNKDISTILTISIKTTETHRAAAMRKLDVKSVAGLVRYAVRNKYFDV